MRSTAIRLLHSWATSMQSPRSPTRNGSAPLSNSNSVMDFAPSRIDKCRADSFRLLRAFILMVGTYKRYENAAHLHSQCTRSSITCNKSITFWSKLHRVAQCSATSPSASAALTSTPPLIKSIYECKRR